MCSRRLYYALALIALTANATFAQPDPTTDTPVPDAAAPADTAPTDDAGTLPPVVVTPPEEQTPVEADVDLGDDPVPFDLPGIYPSLSDVQFEDFGSALRSNRSVFDDPRHVSVIGPQDLRERNARNMVEAIEREVGVMVQRTGAGQASPFIRGLTGPQTLILVDGIRMNNSTFRFGPNQYFALIDPGMIERIEVVRGPQSVLWGSDAIGGVLHATRIGAIRLVR